MSKKSPKIAQLLESVSVPGLDKHYAGYFACFNRGLFYEAHDVLEELWLTDRHGPHGNFYKGLIQFAGAFVHLQKQRLGPAIALFLLSRKYLAPYLPHHERLDLTALFHLNESWVNATEECKKRGGVMPPPEVKLELLA